MQSNLKTKTCVFTIVAPNYFGQALTLEESLKPYAIDFKVVVVCEEDFKTDVFDKEKIIYSHDLGIENYIPKAFQFNILEHCTNIKPSCFKYLFANASYDYIYYIDPDIFFYRTPELINEFFGDATVLLTPHTMTPILDEFKPSDLEFMRTGIFNLGFIGVRRDKESDRFLDWWSSRCLELGFNETSSGLFVDQKWMDLSIVYFRNINFTLNPGLNVAYWNLHERSLTYKENLYLVNSEPLIFFHFSGLDPMRPESLSKHQSRLIAKPGTALHAIIVNYSKMLIKNSAHNKNVVPYTHFSNGVQISDIARRFFWQMSKQRLFHNPFDANADFYKISVLKGYTSTKKSDVKSVSALSDMSQFSRKILIISIIFKITLKILGPSKYLMLIRFLKQRFSIVSAYYEP